MKAQKKSLYKFGSFQLDPEEYVLLHNGEIVSLTPKAFDILLILVRNQGHVVDKEKILEQVWSDTIVEEANVAKNISRLRSVLSEDGLEEPFIETIPKRGYRFVAPVREIDFEASEETEKPEKKGSLTPLTKGLAMTVLIIPFAVIAVGIWYFGSFLLTLTGYRAPLRQPIQMSLLTENGHVQLGTISPDGKSVVFVSNQKDGKNQLLLKRIATGATQELIAPKTQRIFYKPTFSPDGEFIYYSLGRTLYRISVLGGQEVPLLSGYIESSVAVSPDGEKLAFIRLDDSLGEFQTILVSDKNGKNATEIINNKELGYPRFGFVFWSDDGLRLRFNGNKNDLLTSINIHDRSITESEVMQPKLRKQGYRFVKGKSHNFLKDGSGLFFNAKKNIGDKFQIKYLSFFDGKISPVTNDTSEYHSLSVSDDGKNLTAVKIDKISSLFSYDLETGKTKQILKNNKSFVFKYRSFSQMPNGKILFSKKTGEDVDIFSINEDGTDEIQLTSNNDFNYFPVTSPDGNYIVFTSNRDGSWGIWRMNADGSDSVRITRNKENEEDREVQLANNGQTIIFVRQSHKTGNAKLMKVSIYGGQAVPLLPESQTSDYLSKISPDGTKLAYAAIDYKHQTAKSKEEIHLVSLEGEQVVNNKKIDLPNMFEWSPDSRSLTFARKQGKTLKLLSYNLDDGQITSLSSLNTGLPMFKWANDGKKIFIVRTNENRDLVLIRTNSG